MRRFINVLLLIITLLFGFAAASAAEKTYVLSYSPDSPSHQHVKDRVKVAYERAGLKAEFIPLPHSRALMSANAGTVDGDVGRIPFIEQKFTNLRRVNVAVKKLKGVAYTLDPEMTRYDESLLKKYRIGYLLGVRWAEETLAGVDAIAARSTQALFQLLIEGRVDIVLISEVSGDSVLNTLGKPLKKIRQLQPLVYSSPIYHYVNKKNAEIIPRLEQAMREINEEGIYVFYTGVQSPIFEILQQRLKEAFSRIGKVCEVHLLESSQRALLMANEQGDGDAYRNGMIKEISPDLTGNLLLIPEPIGLVEFYVYTNKENLKITDWSSLDGLDNGLRGGAKILEKNIPGNQVRVPDTERLLKMLAENRIDTVTEHAISADFKIQQLNLQGIRKVTPPLVTQYGYSYIHKKHKELIPAISASLAQMKKEGRFEQIEKDVFNHLLQHRQGNAQ